MSLPVTPAFAAIETAVYGDGCQRFSQGIDTINRLHDLLHAHYPGLRCRVYTNAASRLICYEMPDLRFDGEPAAYFGYWESRDDVAAARELFERCRADLRANAIRRLVGPINFSTFFDYRVRLDNFDRLNYPGEPHNPPYYAALLESCGFHLVEKYFSIHTDSVSAPLQRLRHKAGRVLEREHPFAIVPLHEFDIEKYLAQVYRLIDQSFREALAYVPLAENVFRLTFDRAAIARYCHATSCVALLNGEAVGLLLSLPDWAELDAATKAQIMHGAATLDAALHGDRLAVRRAYIKTICVKPELRNSGLYAHLFVYFLNNCQNRYAQAGGALMRLGNAANKLALDLFDDERSTRIEYGLYARTLE